MTIEEKARAYDELFAKAKRIYNKENDVLIMHTIEDLFPKLAESEKKPNGGIVREDFTQGDGWYKVNLDYLSKAQVEEIEQLVEKWNPKEVSEDEKIKKAILIYLDWLDGKKDYLPKGDYTIKDMILWLERQGEHANFLSKIQVGDKVTRNEYGVLVNLSQLKRVAKPNEEQGEQKPEENKGNIGGISSNSEWSDEDEENFCSVYLDVKSARQNTVNSLSGDLKEQEQKRMDEVISWLESLKGRVQPKQEWSEEDKYMYDILCGTIENTDINENTKYKLISWLKSLRPQNRWKPSELQLGCLSDAIEHYNSLGYPAPKLKELLDDLKKIKEGKV